MSRRFPRPTSDPRTRLPRSACSAFESRSYNDDNLQIILGTKNSEKSNKLPPVSELAKLRDVWPEHWGDVLPTAIDCPAEYLRAPWCLRTARPRSERKIYSELITDPFYDDDWLRSFDKLFGVRS